MDLNKINLVCRLETLPTKRMSDLEVGEEYGVTGVRRVNTKYGTSILLALNEQFEIFLPPRIVSLMENDVVQFNAMQKTIIEGILRMKYQGGEYNKFEFLCDR